MPSLSYIVMYDSISIVLVYLNNNLHVYNINDGTALSISFVY